MSTRAERIQAAKKPETSTLNCKGVSCGNDKHSYSPAPKTAAKRTELLKVAGMPDAVSVDKPYGPDSCWACGDTSIDWDIPRSRIRDNFPTVMGFLRKELIREIYWTRPIDEDAKRKAQKSSDKVFGRIHSRVDSMLKTAKTPFDAKQTAWDGDVLNYAQHATATCCSKCLKQWHGIDVKTNVGEEEREYMVFLLRQYLLLRSADIWGVLISDEH